VSREQSYPLFEAPTAESLRALALLLAFVYLLLLFVLLLLLLIGVVLVMFVLAPPGQHAHLRAQ
jgi:hypothetical protein